MSTSESKASIGREVPVASFGLGVALIIFALIVTSASRLVFVVAGIVIVADLANGIVRARGAPRDSSTGAPNR